MIALDFSHVDGPAATSDDWMDTVWNIGLTPIDSDAKSVLMALLAYANGPFSTRPLEGAQPTIQNIMDATGLSRSHAQRRISNLIDGGLIQVTDPGQHGKPPTTYALAIYRIVPDALDHPQADQHL